MNSNCSLAYLRCIFLQKAEIVFAIKELVCKFLQGALIKIESEYVFHSEIEQQIVKRTTNTSTFPGDWDSSCTCFLLPHIVNINKSRVQENLTQVYKSLLNNLIFDLFVYFLNKKQTFF